MSQSRKIHELNIQLGRAERSRDEWQRRAQIAENERDALKAVLHHEKGVQGDTLWVGNCAPHEEERHAPAWLSPALTWLGAFTIIAVSITFVSLELYLVSDAWFLLSVLVMAGFALVAVGRHMRHTGLPSS